MILLEGIAGSGKSVLRNRSLADASKRGIGITHLGQFSWLSLDATRTIVRLRGGMSCITEADAITAVCLDLSLHRAHNIGAAVAAGELIVDRLLLSSAALLGAIYGGAVGRFVQPLSNVLSIQPALTVVLTTPPELCWKRLESRRSAARFVESWEMLQKLSLLTQEAAVVWQNLTGAKVIFRNSASEAELDALAAEIAEAMDAPTR